MVKVNMTEEDDDNEDKRVHYDNAHLRAGEEKRPEQFEHKTVL